MESLIYLDLLSISRVSTVFSCREEHAGVEGCMGLHTLNAALRSVLTWRQFGRDPRVPGAWRVPARCKAG